VTALTIGLHHSVVVICLHGIAFFLIIRPDQEKTKIQPWRPWRLVYLSQDLFL
jgi:phage portal protein BeeE